MDTDMDYSDTGRIHPSAEIIESVGRHIPARLVAAAMQNSGRKGPARNVAQALTVLDAVGESNILAAISGGVPIQVIAEACKVTSGHLRAWIGADDDRTRKAHRAAHLGAAFDAAEFRANLMKGSGLTNGLDEDQGRLVNAKLKAASQIDTAISVDDPKKKGTGMTVVFDFGAVLPSLRPKIVNPSIQSVIEYDDD